MAKPTSNTSRVDEGMQSPVPIQTFLTVKQVAASLCLTPGAVYKLCDTGQLVCHRFGAGRGAVRISPGDLKAYIEKSRSDPIGKATAKELAGIAIKRRRVLLTKKLNLRFFELPKAMRD